MTAGPAVAGSGWSGRGVGGDVTIGTRPVGRLIGSAAVRAREVFDRHGAAVAGVRGKYSERVSSCQRPMRPPGWLTHSVPPAPAPSVFSPAGAGSNPRPDGSQIR